MIKIVADSSCDIPDFFNDKTQYNFTSVPLKLLVDGEEFIDTPDQDVDKFLEAMEASKEGSKSSAPAPGDFLDAFEEAEEVYVFCMSSKISATYSSACLAKDMYLEEHPNRFVHIFDTKMATAGTTLSVIKFNELIKKGLSRENLISEMNKIIENTNLYFILENYGNLVKNGRMNPLIAKVASTLNIRPICKTDNGDIKLIEKYRGKKAYNRLVDLINEHSINKDDTDVVITYVKCRERAEEIARLLKETLNPRSIHLLEPSLLCTNYGERGGIMIGFH